MEDHTGAIVLVIDDSPTNLAVLFNYLQEMGLKVLVAQEGESALEQIDAERPDIILLDVLMPSIDGFETCRRLKANPATQDIPVIFMTALADTEDVITGFNIGAVDYITKPFRQEEVLARINAHLTLQQQRMKLYELNAVKDKFFSIVVHDLKETLGTLVSLSDYLVMTVPGGDNNNIRKAAQMVAFSVHNSVKLLENLLNWAKIRNGAMNVQPGMIELHKIVLENIVPLRGFAREKRIALSYEIDDDLLVYADHATTSMILRNLLLNALWFTHRGGEIKVSANPTEGFVEIAVSDTGIGLSAEEQSKLFRLDKKFRKNGTAGEHGTGLGLILCKELVTLNQGAIWVNSKPERGATFTFTLPSEKLGGGFFIS